MKKINTKIFVSMDVPQYHFCCICCHVMVSFSIRGDTLFDQWGSISQKCLSADVAEFIGQQERSSSAALQRNEKQ